MAFRATVLQVIPALDAGGAERTCVEIAASVTAAGGRAIVCSSGGRLEAEIEKVGGKTRRLPVQSKNPLVIYKNAGALEKIIRDEGVDILHVRSRAPAWSALLAARRTGVPLVATYHGAYNARHAIKRFYNSAMVRGDAVIANSEYTAASILAQYPAVAAKLTTISRGADLASFNPDGVGLDRIEALISSWGCSSGDARQKSDKIEGDLPDRAVPGNARAIRILAPGRMTDWKGQADLIEAAALLRDKSAPKAGQAVSSASQSGFFELVFCGEAQGRDEYVANLREIAEQRGVRAMTKFVGHCADMPAAYAWADIVAAPSRRPEAFGRVAVEAGAMGKVVIAADHGGARETIVAKNDAERTGYLIAPSDPAALARVLDEVISLSDGQRAEIGARARARIEADYSTARMCEKTLSVYESLLDKRKVA